MNSSKKGFTLVELLIVIAILAILSVAVVLVLNPAELLKQSRDSTRISDMAALNSAISLYMTDVTSPYLGGAGTACTTKYNCTFATTTAPFGTTSTVNCTNVITSTTIDGTGWVSIKFSDISAGSPLSKLPIDPVNSASFLYAYGCNGLTYKLATNMESSKYSSTTSGYERNSYDGGTSNGWYEVGNKLDL